MSNQESNRIYWNLRTFCIVTGACRGLGQAIAIQFAQKFQKGSVILLLSLSDTGLQQTKQLIEANTKNINVKTVVTDLSEPDNDVYYDVITNTLSEYHFKQSDFEHAIIVHNAATIIREPMAKSSDLTQLHTYTNINLFSMMCLTAQFLKVFPADSVIKRSVVNISSIASQIPHPTMGLYSMGKVVRNMYCSALAAEDPTLDVFSYGPGTVDTAMFRELTKTRHPERIQQALEKGLILRCEEAARLLVDILDKGDYKPGQYKDAFTFQMFVDLELLLSGKISIMK